MCIDDYRIISFGSKVLVKLEGKERIFQIDRDKDDLSVETISADSLIGSRLMRRRKNQRFGMILPGNVVLDCEILKIF